MRTFGTARLHGKTWRITLEPHVAMRLKRVFPRAEQRHGTVSLRSTDEVCRDLEWFAERFPIDFGDSAPALEAAARAYDFRASRALEILSGDFRVPPFEMLLPPRDYQSQAAALAVSQRALLLADEVGLGKTVAALAMLAAAKALPALIVCPTHLQIQWKREAHRFLGLDAHILKRSTPYELPSGGLFGDTGVLISSYHKLSGWRDALAGKVATVIFDEAHELRRTDSDKYRAAEHIAHAAEYRLGLTATPIFNYGSEFWSVVNVLYPDALGNRAEFLREWCVDGFGYGKERVREPKVFGSYLRENAIMLRRTRRDVSRELPAVTTIVQPVECDLRHLRSIRTSAVELAKIILAQAGAHSGLERMKAGGQFDAAMRQATGIAKAADVAQFVRMLLETDDEPVVLFGWHRAVYDLWVDLLREYKPVLYTGSETAAQKDANLRRFLSGESRVLIMSLRSGAGVDGLQRICSRCVIGELDWSPAALEQCIGRIHRDGQPHPVFAYYLVAEEGADPVMRDVLGLKSGQLEGVRDPDAELATPREVDPEHVKKLAEAFLRSQK